MKAFLTGQALTLLFAALLSTAAASAEDSMDHSGHQMSSQSIERDDLGRRLYDNKHQITPEMAGQLREKVALYKNFSDAQIGMSMRMMGSNYTWYLSNDDMHADQGVLLLSHSSRDGDPRLKAMVEGFADIFPMAMSPGMAMMMSDHIQLGLNDLEAAGAKTIVVVPLVSTRHNTLLRQWHYIFGLDDEPGYASVPLVKSNANILFADPPGDSPWIAEILVDHAMEISTNPENELVIVAAHGPQYEADNLEVLAELAQLANLIKEDTDFADVIGMTLQDDAAKDVREANVAKLRAAVTAAIDNGQRVLVVTNLMGTRSIQAKLRIDLDGLDFEFNSKGVSSHPNFANEWLTNTIMNKLNEGT